MTIPPLVIFDGMVNWDKNEVIKLVRFFRVLGMFRDALLGYRQLKIPSVRL